MRVLITGGAGFIGSHCCDAFVDQGAEVICVDDLSSGREQSIAHLKDRGGFTFREHNVVEPLKVDDDLDYVLHFASRASPPDYQTHRIHTLRTNSEGTRNMVALAAEKDARLVYASTSEVYGNPEQHPQTEEYNGNVNPIGPRACYDEGKRYGEAYITSYARDNLLTYTILRIFNTYGPRMRPDDGRVISNFLTQALNDNPLTVYGDGSQTRSFCYIDDLVQGIVTATTHEATDGGIYNLGNPDEHTILELAELVRDLFDAPDIVHEDLPKDDPAKRRPAIDRMTDATGWEPSVALEDGLKATAEHFREYT